MIRKAVIPAAGLGTRFLPATKAQPKEMLPIVDKPVIQFVVEEAVASGIDDILIITGRGKNAIENHFDRSYELEEAVRGRPEASFLEELNELLEKADISYTRQGSPKGLGDAVLCAERHVGGEPFAVLLGDTIVDSKKACTLQMAELAEKEGGSVIAVETVSEADVQKYGIAEGSRVSQGLWRVNGLVEKPLPTQVRSRLGIIGRYILSPAIFPLLRSTPAGKNGEVQLTDALRRLAEKEPVHAAAFEGIRYDIGNKRDYARAFSDYAKRRGFSD